MDRPILTAIKFEMFHIKDRMIDKSRPSCAKILDKHLQTLFLCKLAKPTKLFVLFLLVNVDLQI